MGECPTVFHQMNILCVVPHSSHHYNIFFFVGRSAYPRVNLNNVWFDEHDIARRNLTFPCVFSRHFLSDSTLLYFYPSFVFVYFKFFLFFFYNNDGQLISNTCQKHTSPLLHQRLDFVSFTRDHNQVSLSTIACTHTHTHTRNAKYNNPQKLRYSKIVNSAS